MHCIAFAFATILSIFMASSAFAQVVITQAKVLAGNVTPGDPPGFPVVITQPGAYVLESNLTVPAGNYGFAINAINVDLDMNGFTLSGNGTATYGIYSNFGENRVHGGTINRFQFSAVYIRNNSWAIDNMKITRNGGAAIDAAGMRAILVRNSSLERNSTTGVAFGNESSIENSNIIENGNFGVICNFSCRVANNTFAATSGIGVGIYSGTVQNNIISNSRLSGVVDYAILGDVTLLGNTLIQNNSNGTTQISGGVLVSGNTCIGKPC